MTTSLAEEDEPSLSSGFGITGWTIRHQRQQRTSGPVIPPRARSD
jgi:hypothetical protein